MASAAVDQKTCFAIYRGERNKLIIPVTKEGERRFDLYSQSEVKQSDDGQVDSIDSGVELAYSTTDVDEPPSSVSSCGDTDVEEPRREPSAIEADNVVHIFCRYDSSTPDPAGQQPLVQQPPAASPTASALQQCDEYSSVVEIDGDCIIIHSRQDAPGEEAHQLLEDSAQPVPQDSKAVADVCRWFFEKRSRASAAGSASSGGDRNCTDRVGLETDPGQKTTHPLTSKMALLRKEMSSLVAQDEDLYRQLLALHSSIQTLKWTGADSLSPASSVSSLPDVAGSSCSPSSTLSSCFSRRSHISSDSSSHYEVVDPRFTSSTPMKTDKDVAVIGGSRFRPFARLSSGTRFGQVSPSSVVEKMSPQSQSHHPLSTVVGKPATVSSRMSSLVLNPFSRRKSGAHSSHLSLMEIGSNGKESAAGRKSGASSSTQLPSIDSFTSLTLPRRHASSASKCPGTRSDRKDAR